MTDGLGCRIVADLYFMTPAYLANMAPPFVRFWKGWNPPLSEHWLGSHKTVLGCAAAMLVAVVVTAVQSTLATSDAPVDYSRWPLVALGFGAGVVGGDLLKSFLKRRLGIPPGARWIPFDQLDYVLASLVLLAPLSSLTIADSLTILGLSFIGNIVVNRLSFRLGVKESPW